METRQLMIFCLFDKYAYLSCGFGIVVLDIEREEVYDTYLIGNEGDYINVLDIAFFDNKIVLPLPKPVFITHRLIVRI